MGFKVPQVRGGVAGVVLPMVAVVVCVARMSWPVPASRAFGEQPAAEKSEKSEKSKGKEKSKDAHVTDARITLLGTAEIAADAKDKSGLSGPCGPVEQNTLGSMGSAIDRISGDRYVMIADRGPKDGAEEYVCRYHEVRIAIDPTASTPVSFELLKTVTLTDGKYNYIGLSSAIDATNQQEQLRFDPEGVRVGPTGSLFVSDEYGPFIAEFGRDGKRIRNVAVPTKFGITQPDPKATEEDRLNEHGRVANRGLEGLAISPDGSKLYSLLQSPLIQDGGREGVNCRLLEVDVKTGATREFVYVLENDKLGTNELLAVNDHVLLAIERDGKEGSKASAKNITRIDLRGATDVSKIAALPKHGLPDGVKSVQKTVLIDMLDPRLGLVAMLPEKIEGLAFGPDLPDGRVALLVTNDNDFRQDVKSYIWVFSLPRELLGDVQRPAWMGK